MSVACNRNRQIGSYCLLVEKGSDLKFRCPIQPAMYDLEIEAAEGGGGGGGERPKIFPNPPAKGEILSPSLPLSLFLIVAHPIGKNFFLSPAYHCY